MALKNFIRFVDAPAGLEPDFLGGAGDFPAYAEEFYAMPLRPNDIVRFIFDVAANTDYVFTTLRIGLLAGEEMAYSNVGTVVGGKYWTVTIPSDFAEGCYRFLIYDQEFLATEWEAVSAECVQVEGANTGEQDVTEQRTVDDEPTNTALFLSNVFSYDAWETTGKVIEYRGRQNGWGFDYETLTTFYQRFRIAILLSQPQYPEIKKVYRQSNGYYRQANVAIDKKVTLTTDYFDEDAHDAMANAIKHDELYIENFSYFSADEYEVEWEESASSENRYYELSQAGTELYVQGYDQRNNACGGVDDVSITPPECLEVNDGAAIEID